MIGRATAVALGVLMLATPAASFAQATPDPDSPAGEEYALPLDQARRQAAEGTERPKTARSDGRSPKGSASGREPAPLFGAGVKGRDGGGGNTSGGSGSGGAKGAAGAGKSPSTSGGGSATESEGGARSRERETERTAELSDDGGGSKTGVIAGVVAALLLVGAGAGVGLRRVMGSPKS